MTRSLCKVGIMLAHDTQFSPRVLTRTLCKLSVVLVHDSRNIGPEYRHIDGMPDQE
jgi:hypothetical protein